MKIMLYKKKKQWKKERKVKITKKNERERDA